MSKAPLYFAKELSWLSFNERVLQEAADPRNPIVERVRFLGIFSNNQDEFFKVRVADVRRAVREEEQSGRGEATRLLAKIQDKVMLLSAKFDAIYDDVLKQLEHKKVFSSVRKNCRKSRVNGSTRISATASSSTWCPSG